MRSIYKFLPGIGWFLLTLWLFTLPGSTIPKLDWFHALHGDKLVHAFLFCVLCCLFMLPLLQLIQLHKKRNAIFWLIVVVFSLYGIAIEFIQRDYIANRSFDLRDIIADTTGCFIALWLVVKKGSFIVERLTIK
jgi:VanZ family protein